MKTDLKKLELVKRFRILSLLAIYMEMWHEQMEELAIALDTEHPQSEESLIFYEDKILEAWDNINENKPN